MAVTRSYENVDKAVRAFVRHGKSHGWVRVLGGGWWQVQINDYRGFACQGYSSLAAKLGRAGVLMIHPDGSASFSEPQVTR